MAFLVSLFLLHNFSFSGSIQPVSGGNPGREARGPCGTGSTDLVLQALDDARTNREIKRGIMERTKSAYVKNRNDRTLEEEYEQAEREFEVAQTKALNAYNRAKNRHPGAIELNFDRWKDKNHWKSACWKQKRADFLRRKVVKVPGREARGPCGTGSTDPVLQALDDARTNREIKRGIMERTKSAYVKNRNDRTLQLQYERAEREFKTAQEQAFGAYNRAKSIHPGAIELNFDRWKDKNHWKSACWKQKRADFLRRKVIKVPVRRAKGPCGTGSTDPVLQALDDARTNREIKRGIMERTKSADKEYNRARGEFEVAQEQAFGAYNRAKSIHPGAIELNFDRWKKKNYWKSACWKQKRADFFKKESKSARPKG